MILVCSVLVSGFSERSTQNILTENALNVNSLSASDSLTVIIDPGHGGADGGAVASNGVLEKDLNLDLSLRLRDMLLFHGHRAVMTREEDMMHFSEGSPLSKKVQDTKYRVELTKSYENCIFVSIHMNKFVSPKYSGLQVYYSQNHPESVEIAKRIQTLTRELLQSDNDRKVKKANSTIYVLDKATVPAVLVECGFLSNEKETALLCSGEYRKLLASVIFEALDGYISEKTTDK
jgi:N-acetylmuramoyl-L-alanine amidase